MITYTDDLINLCQKIRKIQKFQKFKNSKNCYICVIIIRSKCANLEWTEMVKGLDGIVRDLMVYLGKVEGDPKLDIFGKYSF